MYFDIGSNIGRWTLANINNTSKIISVEASPNTFNSLLGNLGNNPKTVCLNYAVCNNNGEDITFYDSVANTLSTMNKEWLTSPSSRFHNTGYSVIKCKTITIDKLIETYGMPELIKVDVEGGEYDCISSLTQKVKNLCFEWASETNDITFKCLDYLYSIGFTRFCIQYEDNYTYRPSESIYTTDLDSIKSTIRQTTPKIHWGMIWCK